MLVEVRSIEAADRVTKMIRRLVGTLPCGHEQIGVGEHSLNDAGFVILPPDDALGRIPSAKNGNPGLRKMEPGLARNVDVQAPIGHGCTETVIPACNPSQHLRPLRERRAGKLLVRKDARQCEDHSVRDR